MDTSLLLLKCIGMPCCEFGLACANTSKSLQTWYGSWFTNLMQLDNLARSSPICTCFPTPSMRCSEILWCQNRLLTLSSRNSSLTSPFFIAFFKAGLHRAGYAFCVAQTSGSKSQKESQEHSSLSPFFSTTSFLPSNAFTAALNCCQICDENRKWWSRIQPKYIYHKFYPMLPAIPRENLAKLGPSCPLQPVLNIRRPCFGIVKQHYRQSKC